MLFLFAGEALRKMRQSGQYLFLKFLLDHSPEMVTAVASATKLRGVRKEESRLCACKF